MYKRKSILNGYEMNITDHTHNFVNINIFCFYFNTTALYWSNKLAPASILSNIYSLPYHTHSLQIFQHIIRSSYSTLILFPAPLPSEFSWRMLSSIHFSWFSHYTHQPVLNLTMFSCVNHSSMSWLFLLLPYHLLEVNYKTVVQYFLQTFLVFLVVHLVVSASHLRKRYPD